MPTMWSWMSSNISCFKGSMCTCHYVLLNCVGLKYKCTSSSLMFSLTVNLSWERHQTTPKSLLFEEFTKKWLKFTQKWPNERAHLYPTLMDWNKSSPLNWCDSFKQIFPPTTSMFFCCCFFWNFFSPWVLSLLQLATFSFKQTWSDMRHLLNIW